MPPTPARSALSRSQGGVRARRLSSIPLSSPSPSRPSQSASGASACAASAVRHVLPPNPGVRRKRSGGDPSRAARALSARGSGAMTPIPVGSSVGACDAHDSAARLVTARRGGATGRVRGASGSRFPERVLLTSLKPSCCAFMFLLAGRSSTRPYQKRENSRSPILQPFNKQNGSKTWASRIWSSSTLLPKSTTARLLYYQGGTKSDF